MEKFRVLFCSIIAFSAQTMLRADDFGNVDFSLRFPATLSRLSSYADVAAKGGASAAGRYGSSINPAANAWLFPKYYEAGVSAQYSYVNFDAGNELDFFSQSATVDLHEFGTVRVSLGEIRSNDHNIRDFPIRYSYTLDGVRTEWANKIGKDVSIGAGFSFTNSDTALGTTKLQLIDANNKLYLGRVGILWGPAEHWILGLEADCGNNHTRSTGVGGAVNVDDTLQTVVRTGVTYEFMPNTLMHLDFHSGWFSNDTGRFDEQRIVFGTDIPVTKSLFLRMGAGIDSRQNWTWTTGFGFSPRKGLAFDFAYQDDNFPEVQREFGHSRTLNASVSWQF